MKIVHIITRFNVGGTATWLTNLSDSLIDSGNESFLFAGNIPKDEIEDRNLLEINGIRIRSLQQSFSPFQALLAFLQIRRSIKKLNPDIVNTHTSVAGVIGRLACLSLLKKRPTIVHTVHGHLLTGYFKSWKRAIVIGVERILSSFSDLILFSGERVRSEFINATKISSWKTALVSPGVAIASKTPHKSKQTGKVVVGWLGRFVPIKDPALAIEVARHMPDIEFKFGGDGPLLEECEKNASSNCYFVGWTSPERFWNGCDIALLTSKNEAQPISIIEAGLLKIPAVITPAGSAIEVVEDKVTGLVTEPQADKLSKAISELLKNRKLLESLGQNAQESYRIRYSLEKQLVDHLTAYKYAISLRLRMKEITH
jgi:glycosyltransferase involved in cell wall biosynthesis